MRRQMWHLTGALVATHFAVLFLLQAYPESWRALALVPGEVAARPWSLVTYQLIDTLSIWFLFSMYILWIMGRPLEEEWGSPRFLAFWLVSTLGAAGGALLVGRALAGDIFLDASLLFTFATLYPETEFRLFFILPIKVKWLAVVGGAWLVFSSLQWGLLLGVANVAGTAAGYLFFLATRRLPSRRKVSFELKKRRAEVLASSETASAERRNLGWDDRVRAAESRAREQGEVAPEDRELLAELDASVDPSITVCAPADFGYTDDDVCRGCTGYAECAARRIRRAAEEGAGEGRDTPLDR